MKNEIRSRLMTFGYELTGQDDLMLDFIIPKVEASIRNSCNITAVPAELGNIAVDMALGELLMAKKNTGNLVGFNLEAAVKSIQEGDTAITFADSKSGEDKLDMLIKHLMGSGKGELVSYRRIKW